MIRTPRPPADEVQVSAWAVTVTDPNDPHSTTHRLWSQVAHAGGIRTAASVRRATRQQLRRSDERAARMDRWSPEQIEAAAQRRKRLDITVRSVEAPALAIDHL